MLKRIASAATLIEEYLMVRDCRRGMTLSVQKSRHVAISDSTCGGGRLIPDLDQIPQTLQHRARPRAGLVCRSAMREGPRPSR